MTSDPCTDLAGNTATGVTSADFQIDKTAPVITDEGPTTDPNSNGWYNTDVTNEFSLDAGTGPNAASLPRPSRGGNAQTKTTSGKGIAVNSDLRSLHRPRRQHRDRLVTSAGFQIDKTAPVITDGGPTTEPEQRRLVQHRRHQRVQPGRRDLRPQRGLCRGLPGQRPVQDDELVRASRST